MVKTKVMEAAAPDIVILKVNRPIVARIKGSCNQNRGTCESKNRWYRPVRLVGACRPILDINVNAKIISQNDLHLTHGRCTVDALNNGFDSIQVLESIVESFLIFEIMSFTRVPRRDLC